MPRIGALAIFVSGSERLGPVAAVEQDALVVVAAVVVVPVDQRAGRAATRADSAYIESTPVTSTSHALGMSFSLIMLMHVQTLQPQFCCRLVQHWMAVASRSLAATKSSSTTPSRAICTSLSAGTPADGA